MNARIGNKGRKAWYDENEEENEGRRTKDKTLNAEGRAMIERMEERGWVMLNGNKDGDERGEWTYEKAGKKSIIDYGITNWEAWERIGPPTDNNEN